VISRVVWKDEARRESVEGSRSVTDDEKEEVKDFYHRPQDRVQCGAFRVVPYNL
jgi:hypothetical protein